MDEKLTGMYPPKSATPDKILKKLGFRNGTKSRGTLFEHGAIADPHKTAAKAITPGSGKVNKDVISKVKTNGTHVLDKATTQGMMRKLLYER